MTLMGWNEISAYLQSLWEGRDVSRWSAMRYARDHGLPVRRVRGRVIANTAKIAAWAANH